MNHGISTKNLRLILQPSGYTQYIDAILALGTAYARRKGRSGETFDYVDGRGGLELNAPNHQFYPGLGFLAMGEPELARDQVTVLTGKDAQLANRLSEFIDRDYNR
ncbi:MAG: hypothetical protein WKF92_03610 [Pyrinomonadaceae bacterium]